jgi:hypothetical protein
MKLPEPKFINIAEASEILGVTIERVHWFISARYVACYYLGDRISVPLNFNHETVIKLEISNAKIIKRLCSLDIKLSTAEVYELKATGTTGTRKEFEVAVASARAKCETSGDLSVDDTQKQQTPEKYISVLREHGEPDSVIAVRLKDKFPGIQLAAFMKLIDPKRVMAWEQSQARQGRPKQWFTDLRKKGKRILEDRRK